MHPAEQFWDARKLHLSVLLECNAKRGESRPYHLTRAVRAVDSAPKVPAVSSSVEIVAHGCVREDSWRCA